MELNHIVKKAMPECRLQIVTERVTIQLAAAARSDPALRHIKVNSAAPGYVATDMNDHQGTRTVAEGARVITQLASLPDDGPSGGFFNDQGPVSW